MEVGSHSNIIWNREVSQVSTGFSTLNIHNLSLSGSDDDFGPYGAKKKGFQITETLRYYIHLSTDTLQIYWS